MKNKIVLLTPEKILEGNILIAEKLVKLPKSGINYEIKLNYGLTKVTEYCTKETLKFHQDWNWLMIAVHQICKYCDCDFSALFNLYTFWNVTNIEQLFLSVVKWCEIEFNCRK